MEANGIYPVNEIFLSVQFEGSRSGTLNHFIRLSKCNRKCDFCDTVDNSNVWKELDTNGIMDVLREQGPKVKNVVITGGEPTIHNLEPLLTELKGQGYYVAIETNGDFLRKLKKWRHLISWITASPKGTVDDTLVFDIVDEVKYIVPDHENLINWNFPRIFIQPEWNNPDAFQECLSLMVQHPGVRVSVQTHKYLNIR